MLTADPAAGIFLAAGFFISGVNRYPDEYCKVNMRRNMVKRLEE